MLLFKNGVIIIYAQISHGKKQFTQIKYPIANLFELFYQKRSLFLLNIPNYFHFFPQFKVAYLLFYQRFRMGCSESRNEAIMPGIYKTMPQQQPMSQTSNLTNPVPQNKQKSTPKKAKSQDLQQQQIEKAIFEMAFSKKTLYGLHLNFLQKLFENSSGDMDEFFKMIEEQISNLFMNLSKETLELMNQNVLSSTQGKLHIAEEILYTSLNVLKLIGSKNSHNYNPSVLKKFNHLQIAMLGYLKVKYPRGGKSFVPAELMKQFKSFDMVEEPQNDLLREANVYFGNEDQKQLIRDLKQFFNDLIDELDTKFPVFQELLQEKIFKISDQERVYTVDYKIGRKIPESISKFTFEQQNFLQINSPEIFRVIIKWVGDMEDYLLNPSDQVLQKNSFKLVSSNRGKIEVDEISPDEVPNLVSSLQANLASLRQQHKGDLRQLGMDIQLFNHNLIKVLSQVDRRQKYVPKREAQIIKYSMYNTKLLSWMLMEKLLIVMKKLIKVGKSMKSILDKNMDLIKFNVTDLFRAMITGTKSEIFKVYHNMKKMEKNGDIKIIKIKNRLGTHLNDVMIIFKMKGSYIICELQLILTDGQKVQSQKGKNIQVLNHFFYQLERSPYGVMLELAVLMGFKDNKVSFEEKITFDTIGLKDFNCTEKHPQQVINYEVQRKPFICSSCTEYYNPYQNQFIYKNCKKCNMHICSKCLFETQPQLIKQYYLKAIQKAISIELQKMDQIQTRQLRKAEIQQIMEAKKKNESSNISCIISFLGFKNAIMLRDMNDGKVGKISKKKMKKYLSKNLKYVEKTTLLCIGHFQGEDLKFFSMLWKESNGDPLVYGFDPVDKQKDIHFKYNDFMLPIPLNKKQYSEIQIKKEQQKFYLLDSYEKSENLRKNCKFYPIQISGEQIYIAFDKNQPPANENQADPSKNHNSEQKNVITAMRNKLPVVKQTKQNYELSNMGITSDCLIYFKNIDWKNEIIVINLSKNDIKKLDYLLPYIPNIEKLNLSHNMISSIEFPFHYAHLNKFICINNQITEIKNLQYISNAKIINFSTNCLTSFNSQNSQFKNLRELNLLKNAVSLPLKIYHQQYPNLMTFQFTQNYYLSEPQEQSIIRLPKLISFHSSDFNSQSLKMQNCSRLTSLKIYEGNLRKIQFTILPVQMKQLTIKNTVINSYPLLQLDLPLLQNLEIDRGDDCITEQLPIINMPLLQNLKLNYIGIKGINNLTESKLNFLECLELMGNCIQVFPVLNFAKLKELRISQNYEFNNLNNLNKINLPELEIFVLDLISTDIDVPLMNGQMMPKLKFLVIGGGKYSSTYKFELLNLQNLELKDFIVQNSIQVLNLPKLQKLSIYNSQLTSLDNLSISTLDKLQSMVLNCNASCEHQIKFPILKLKNFKDLQVQSFYLRNIQNLSHCQFPQIQQILINYDQINHPLPILKFPTLKKMTIYSSQLSDITNLTHSTLPSLQDLILSYNNFKILPILNMPLLIRLDISFSHIEDIQAIKDSNLEKMSTFNISGNQIKICKQMDMPYVSEFTIDKKLQSIEFLRGSNFKSLKKLSICHLQLISHKLPSINLEACVDLEIINTNIIDLTDLSSSFLPALKTLTINNNMITQLPSLNLPELMNLKCNSPSSVVTGKKKIKNISKLQFSSLPKIVRMEFERNQIESLPQMNFPNLKQIFIMDNQIKDVSGFIRSVLPSLNLINLYGSPITQFPLGKDLRPKDIFIKNAKVEDLKSLSKFSLKLFRLHYNESLMPEEIPALQFPQANRLQFQKCNIKNIDSFCKNPLPEIEEISFVDNQITRLPPMICPKLKRFFLNKNKINDVKDFVAGSDLSSVDMISLEFNQIEDLVDFPFENPKQIFLSQNLIKDISCMSKYCYKNLNMLVVFNCKVVGLPKLNAPICKKIYFNSNLITTASLEQMQGSILPQLTLIHLADNKIDSLSPLNKIQLPKLHNVYLMNNKITELTCLITCKSLQLLNLKNNLLTSIGNFLDIIFPNFSTFVYTIDPNLSEDEKTAIRDKINLSYEYGVSEQ